MLSILIPVYNYDITKLVNEIHKQATEAKIEFEIIAYDDGSKSIKNSVNNKLNELKFCSFKELHKNVGRSAIRNLLANNSSYENLLFLDSDVFPKNRSFIKNYLDNVNSKVIYGGLTHTKIPPKKSQKLRWYYTKKRESKTGPHSSNFLIKKSIFNSNCFDESLINYGYEDLLFFDALANKNIPINYIENPVIHNDNDTANDFIYKNKSAIKNLIYLIENKKISKNRLGVTKYYYSLNKMWLSNLVKHIFLLTKPLIKKNLNSSHPSMLLFDFYRLGYLCLLKNKK